MSRWHNRTQVAQAILGNDARAILGENDEEDRWDLEHESGTRSVRSQRSRAKALPDKRQDRQKEIFD